MNYAIAISFALAIFGLKILIQPFVPGDRPYIMFFFAITFSSLYGGFESGMITTLVAVFLANLFFIEPRGFVIPTNFTDSFWSAIFIAEGIAISMISGRLRSASELYHQTIEGVQDYAIFTLDPKGFVTSWNTGAQRIKGYKAQEIIGQHFSFFYTPEAIAQGMPETLLQTALKEGRAETESWSVRKDGSRFWANTVIRPLYDRNGLLRGFSRVVRDVTERRMHQEAIREREARLAGIINSAMDAIISVDDSQKITLFNHAAEAIFGYSAIEMIGQPLERLLPERFRSAHAGHVAQFGATGVTRRSMQSLGQLLGRRANGEEFPIEATISQLLVDGNKIYTAIIRDISERMAAETALRESENRYRTLFNSIDAGFGLIKVIFDDHQKAVDYYFLDINPQFAYLTNLDREEVLRTTSIRKLLRDLEEKWFQIYERIVLSRQAERLIEFSPRTGRWFDVYVAPVGKQEEHKIAILFNDITERRHAELALERYAKRLSTLHEIDKAILIAETGENIADTALNHLRRLLKCEQAIIALYDFEHRQAEIRSIDSTLPNDYAKNTILSFEALPPLGKLIEGKSAYIPDIPAMPVRPVSLEKRVQAGIRSILAVPMMLDGSLFGSVILSSAAVDAFSPDDQQIVQEVAAQLAIAFRQSQMNEQIRQHTQELEQKVIERTARLSALNRELEAFSFSVSHDLRSPLRAMDGYSQALLEDYHDRLDDEGRHYLERIIAVTHRMAQLIDDLLALSRLSRTELNIESINLSQIASEVVDELRTRQPERAPEIIVEADVTAKGDRRLLKIAFENLIGNAWKFTSKRPDARIEFGCIRQEDKTAYFVRDNGAGFNMEHAGKLFGAFQRLHRESEFEGTGIGLAIVQRIIHRHGGDIWAESAVNQGATFYFTLSPQEK